MVKMGAREFVYPNFGYRSRWLRNRDPEYTVPVTTSAGDHRKKAVTFKTFPLTNGE